MKKITNHLYKILGIAVCAAISYGFVQAQSASWTAPSVAAPGGNVSAPIHVGSTAQVKEGNLGVSGSNGGVRIFDRANAAQSWQWYANNDSATSKSWLRLWDHQNTRDALWATDTGLNVRGGVWTGNVYTSGLQVSGGSPAVGKVLGATDASGTVGWVNDVGGTAITCPSGKIPVGSECKYMRITSETRQFTEEQLYDPTTVCEVSGDRGVPAFSRTTVSPTDTWLGLGSDFSATASPLFTTSSTWGARTPVGKRPSLPASGCWNVYNNGVGISGAFFVPVSGDGISNPAKAQVNSLAARKLCELSAGGPEWVPTAMTLRGGWSSPGDNYLWFWSESQNRYYALLGWQLWSVTGLTCSRTLVDFF